MNAESTCSDAHLSNVSMTDVGLMRFEYLFVDMILF